MRNLKTLSRNGYILAALLVAGSLLSGCASTTNHIFDPIENFAGLKNYSWATTATGATDDSLLVKNIQYFADQALAGKGLTRVADNPDFLISISREDEMGMYHHSYQLQMLTLYVRKADTRQLMWQGSVAGTINTDSTSGNLKKTVEEILANFPPTK